MIIHRTVEFVNYRAPSNPGHERTPLFLRNLPESERGHDRIEISENARKRYMDNNSSHLEKAVLRALPGLERFRDDLRKTESESDVQRRERLHELKSKILMDNYHVDEIMLTRVTNKLISQLTGK